MAVCAMLFDGNTFVVMMNYACFACTAFSAKVSAAVSAEQLGCQQIIIFRFMTGWRFSVDDQLGLYTVKKFFGNNRWDTVRHHNIAENIFTHVAAVAEHSLNAVEVDGTATAVSDASLLKKSNKLLHGSPFIVALKGLQYEWCFQRIELIMLLCVDDVTKWYRAAVKLLLECVLCQAAAYLFSEVSGIIFCKTFQHGLQDDALCAV